MIVLDKLDEKIYSFIGSSSPRKYILETFGGLNRTDADKPVYENFLRWLEKVPKLEKAKYPATFAYVEDEKNKDIIKMQEEMKNEEFYIPRSQHLFHGGVFPIENPRIGDQIDTISMFSTTIDPYTASMHAIQEDPKNLWVIKLNENTRALPLCIDGMEESEILVFSSLKLKL